MKYLGFRVDTNWRNNFDAVGLDNNFTKNEGIIRFITQPLIHNYYFYFH